MKYLKKIINELYLLKPWKNTTIKNRKLQICWSLLTIGRQLPEGRDFNHKIYLDR